MSEVLIIGGGGMVGQKLTSAIARNGLDGDPSPDVTLFDLGFPDPGAPATHKIIGDLDDIASIAAAVAKRPKVIFHLACIVSGESETNFDKGWQTNLLSFWQFLECLRREHLSSGGAYIPRVIFTSSIAVFGPPFPDKIDDEFLCSPQTSYGAQKAAAELMLADMVRRGFVDGFSIRLPTICVRPGRANLAASSFFSGIIREPLNGQNAVLPVSETVRHWHASPRSAAGFLRHAVTIDTTLLKGRYMLNLPGVSCTVGEQIEALRDIAGNDVVKLIQRKPDETIADIIRGWPEDFAPQRALDLGFHADQDFHQIIRTYIEDDLPT